MPNSTTTLRPNGTIANLNWVDSGGTVPTLLADNSDSSYTEGNTGSSSSLVMDLTTLAFPALSQIRSVTPRARLNPDPSSPGFFDVVSFGIQIGSTNFVPTYSGVATATIATLTGTSYATNPLTGAAWSQADIDALHWIGSFGASSQIMRFYEAYVDVAYNQAPVVAPSAPARTVTDGVTTNTSNTVTSATAFFQSTDVGKSISGAGIPANTTISSINSSTSVVISAPATATATAVTFVIGAVVNTTNTPTVIWSYTDPEGDPQERFQVKIFDAATIAAGGFNPETSTPTVSSGEVLSATSLWTATSALLPSVTYTPYVKASDNGSGGRYGNWAAGTPFSITPTAGLLFDLPAAPTVTSATPDVVNNRVAVVVQGIDNDLTRNQSSGESSSTGWTGITNVAATYPQRTTVAGAFLHGLAGIQMRSGAAGTMSMRSTTAVTLAALRNEAVLVLPTQVRTGLASFKAASVTGRTATLTLTYYDATGATVGSPTTGGSITILTSGWTQASVQATVPANAVYETLTVNVLGAVGASEDIYVDQIDVGPGTSTVWTRGGFVQPIGALTDTFTRGDSASVLGNSEGVGTPAWTVLTATWGIQGNRAYVSSGTSNSVAVITTPANSDGVIQADFVLSPTANRAYAGLIFRASDGSNYLTVQIAKIGTGANDVVFLSKNVAASFTQLNQATALGLVNGSTYGLRAEIFGGLIRVYLDRKDGKGFVKLFEWQLSAADITTFADPARNKVGMMFNVAGGNDDGGSRIDNFSWSNPKTQLVILERSIDAGATWSVVRSVNRVALTDPGQVATLYDYEAPRQQAVRYRAKVQAAESDQTFVGPYSSALVMAPNLASDGSFWLKSPTSPALNMAVAVIKDSVSSHSDEHIAVYNALGRADPIVMGDTIRLEVFDGLDFLFPNDAAWLAFEVLRARQETLLLQTCYGDTVLEQFWVRLGPTRALARMTMSTSPGQLRRAKIAAHQVLVPVVS